jgi:hypothetical protein
VHNPFGKSKGDFKGGGKPMKLRGFSPMQPVCEVCDEVLSPNEIGRVFQTNFYHEECFPGTKRVVGTQGKIESAAEPAQPVAASVN